jgi:pimeloyl-ACP methyl ester carboxylesterase
MLTTALILLACILILVGILQVWSPGTPQPIVDANGKPLAGSISKKIFININGVNQGMFIKGRNVNNPVLLYLHGGIPDYFLTQTYPTGLEDHFAVVWWEQRGSGISYSDDISPATMNQEQMIADTLEVTNTLRHRFGREKIYLMAHSGGTFIGIQAAARAPDLYYAYMGVAQMSNQSESERLAYEYMLQQFKVNGNAGMVKRLEADPVTLTGGVPKGYQAVRDQAMHSLGIGTTHEMRSVFSGIFLPSLQFREYTLTEKINLWRGKSRSGIASLWNTMAATDLNQQLTKLDLPVYFFHGVYDYTCNYSLAREYFQKIKAPIKGFYSFELSAHSPMFEEPERMNEILQKDVLTGSNTMADAK